MWRKQDCPQNLLQFYLTFTIILQLLCIVLVDVFTSACKFLLIRCAVDGLTACWTARFTMCAIDCRAGTSNNLSINFDTDWLSSVDWKTDHQKHQGTNWKLLQKLFSAKWSLLKRTNDPRLFQLASVKAVFIITVESFIATEKIHLHILTRMAFSLSEKQLLGMSQDCEQCWMFLCWMLFPLMLGN